MYYRSSRAFRGCERRLQRLNPARLERPPDSGVSEIALPSVVDVRSTKPDDNGNILAIKPPSRVLPTWTAVAVVIEAMTLRLYGIFERDVNFARLPNLEIN